MNTILFNIDILTPLPSKPQQMQSLVMLSHQDLSRALELFQDRITFHDGTRCILMFQAGNILLAEHVCDSSAPEERWERRTDQLTRLAKLYTLELPKWDKGGKKNLYLDPLTMARATRLGHGVPSQGIRRAMEYLAKECGL